MTGHLLLTVLSLVVYFHAAYSIPVQKMLVAVAQFSKDFSWPRINEVAYVLGRYLSAASCLTEKQCPGQLHWIYA